MILSLCLISCQKSQEIKAVGYKKGSVTKEFNGSFYSTKYGGLNYYISDEKERESLFKTQNIDSIVLIINKRSYTATPLVRKAYSREISSSDFSFFVNEKERKIIVDTINGMNTILLFSAKTDMEKMKDEKIIKFTLINE